MMTKETGLDPIAKATLKLAYAIAELRRALPANHRMQSRLAGMATEITGIARGIEGK